MGEALALALAVKGADVALLYRSSGDAANKSAQAIRSLGRNSLAIRGDVGSEKSCRDVMAKVAREFGGLDIYIHMASRYESREWREMDAKEWDAAFHADARGAFLMSLAAAKLMKKRAYTGGRIILFSDWVAASGRPRYKGFAAYYAAKGAARSLAESLALELAPEILVNAIAPGPILPPVKATRKEIESVRKTTPLLRWGGVHEIVKAAMFLIESDYVTGECLRVDGGRHLL